MRRAFKLVILLSVLALLIVSYVILSKKTESNDDIPEKTPDIVAFSVEEMLINRISYAYENEKVELIKRDGKWYDYNDETFPLIQSYPNSMASTLSHIQASRVVSEDGKNKEDFGLDNADFVISFSTSDGSEYVFNIGDYNRISDGYYISISSDSKIYLSYSSVTEAFEYALLDMIQGDSLPSIESNSITRIEYIYQGEKGIIEKDASGGDNGIVYNNVDMSGSKTPADSIKSAEFVSTVSLLALDKCEAYKPSADMLNKYGLGDNKYLTLKIDYVRTVKSDNDSTSVEVKTDETVTLNIGQYDGRYYGIKENSDLLYSLKDEEAKLFISALEAIVA